MKWSLPPKGIKTFNVGGAMEGNFDDTSADGLHVINPVIDQALDYLGRYDRSKGS